MRRKNAQESTDSAIHTVKAAQSAKWCVTVAVKVSGCLIDRNRKAVTPTKLKDDMDSRAIMSVSIIVHMAHSPVQTKPHN